MRVVLFDGVNKLAIECRAADREFDPIRVGRRKKTPGSGTTSCVGGPNADEDVREGRFVPELTLLNKGGTVLTLARFDSDINISQHLSALETQMA